MASPKHREFRPWTTPGRFATAGFTLIELLVVIGIIALLAAMLLAALKTAQDKGKQTQCLNNQRQLSIGFELYLQAFDETYPWYTRGNPGAGQEGGWIWYDTFPVPQSGQFDPARGVLFDHVGRNTAVYRCPSDTTVSLNSYGANSLTCRVKRQQVASPSSVLLLIEEGSAMPTSNDGYFDVAYPDHVVNRHNKGSVFVYVDGHVAWNRWTDQQVWTQCELDAK